MELRRWESPRQCLNIREKHLPDHGVRFNTMSMLGEVLIAPERFAETEEVPTTAHAGLSRRSEVPSQYQLNVLKHLIRLYQKWGARNRPRITRND